MHPHTLFMMVAATVFSTASLAQTASPSAVQDRDSQAPRTEPTTKKESKSIVDCREEMANAKDAQQAGHITDKEYTAQKKMAETKLKRDSTDPRRAEQNVPCK